MKKLLIGLLLTIAVFIGINFKVYCNGNDINDSLKSNSHIITTVEFNGRWVLIGYKLDEKACTVVQNAIEFDSPEKDSVKVFQDKRSYTVYKYFQDELNNRLLINKTSYFYMLYSKDIYIMIEFPIDTNNVLYGLYEVYFMVKEKSFNKKVSDDINNFFILFFSGKE